MGLQPEYGEKILREMFMDEDCEFYRFIKQGSDDTHAARGTLGASAIGVTLKPEEQTTMVDGFPVKRTKWLEGETPEGQRTGIAFIELGNTVLAGQKLQSDATGRGIPTTMGTTPSSVELEGVNGEAVEGGHVGDFIRIDLDRRG